MENFVKRAEDKIADMKSQLDEMKEIQNQPIKKTLQNAIKNLEKLVAGIKGMINELKNNIINGCKNAVEAFKEHGAAALDKLASFFHVKDGLQNISTNIDKMIEANDNAVNKINTFANEYHKAGRSIKNMARVAVGKQPIDAVKEAGVLAKTISAPYKAEKAVLVKLKKSVEKAAVSLDINETKVAIRQAEKPAKKPSMLGELAKNLELVEQSKRENRVHERKKVQEATV